MASSVTVTGVDELRRDEARQLSDDSWLLALAFAAGFGTGQRLEVSVDAVIAGARSGKWVSLRIADDTDLDSR